MNSPAPIWVLDDITVRAGQDPQIAELLPVLNAGFPRVETMTGSQARAAVRARLQPADPEPVGGVEERTVPGLGGAIPIRIYWPAERSDSMLPVAVYAHGGGFVFCDLDSHDGLCRAMTNGLGAVVVSVDYRLAPEARWPAAADDVYAATCWVAHNAEELRADPGRLVIAGDSAGGNLAAVTAVMARDRGGPDIACQVLLYPVIAADFTTASYRRFGEGFYNTAAAMAWYWDQYVPRVTDRSHRYASPIQDVLVGLPPAVVVTAGCDPLCSEGQAYAEALAARGIATTHRAYPGAIHGFLTMPMLQLAQRARQTLWADIAGVLAG
ncbi:alpha/beta hydrolase [Mycolicibacter sinensis]|uniref:Esterase n=1 Tax=Mycolicibacter sinensis (strain JDM601) TaxID=875328 RepID=A0A1A3TM44_MYCSD|nr:alpha/beta hydrolase [Mycolicibacter sinensis]OBK83387.1 esterase [Mycolicibacter sinensis]